MQNTVSIGLVLTFLMVFSFLLAYVAMHLLVVGPLSEVASSVAYSLGITATHR